MSRGKHSKIRIANPAKEAGQYTSLKCALRYVARGRARWADKKRTTIEFLKQDVSQLGYDRAADSGLAKMPALANTPVVAAGILLKRGRNTGATRGLFKMIRGPQLDRAFK